MSLVPAARHRASAQLVLTACLALAVLLLAATGARAASPITGFYAGPITSTSTCSYTGAGAVPATDADTYEDFCIAYSTATTPPTDIDADDLKSQVIDTPLGFAANAGSYPHCTADQFAYTDTANMTCPDASQVGTSTADIRTQVTATTGSSVGVSIPSANIPGQVYNLTPAANEVARLGIVLRPKVVINQPLVKVLVSIRLRPAPNVGLESVIDNLPNTVLVDPPNHTARQTQQVAIDDFALTLWGAAGHTAAQTQPFIYLGSDCTTDQTTHVAAVSYDGTPTSADATPYRLTNCDSSAIPFTPSAQVTTTSTSPDTTTQATVKVSFGQSTDATHVSSTVKSTTVVLPSGLAFSGQIASGADGLPLCTADAFAQTSSAENTCPSGSDIGDVTIDSPATAAPLTGEAYLGAQPQTHALPDLYIEASLGSAADAPRVKLIAHLSIDSQNRVVATLDDLPQLPVSDLSLTFRGGDHSALVTPQQCGTYTGELHAVSWAQPTVTNDSTDTYSVSDACNTPAFSPQVAFALDNPNSAGGSSPLTSTVSRADRSPRFSHVQIDLPEGQLATLKGVPECGASDAAAGTCPESTKVGTITSFAGVGPAPFAAAGSVYLASPATGDVAALVFEVPIKFGDVDLGQLTLPARVQIRSTDLGLRVIADVPQRFNGIPLNLQGISIRLDRPGFALSPTSCGNLFSTSAITDDAGDTASVQSAPFTVSGCDALPFSPQLDTAITGATGNNSRPNVSVRITNAAGSVALKQTFVLLPKGLSVDLNQIPRACSIDQFEASSCPATAAVGKASGALSITDEPLTGTVYLLKVTGQALPGIGLAFTGRFAGNVVGTTAVDPKSNQLRTNFAAIPDLPITALQIDITGGTNGLLIATSALCSAPTVGVQATFVSQAKPSTQRTAYTYCGAALGASVPHVQATLRSITKGNPLVAVSVGAPSASGTQLKLKSFDVTLPSGYAFVAARAKSTKGVAVQDLTVKGTTTTKRVSTTKLRVTLPAAGTTFAKVLTRSGTITLKSTSRRKSTKAVAAKVDVVYTNGQKASIPLSLTPLK